MGRELIKQIVLSLGHDVLVISDYRSQRAWDIYKRYRLKNPPRILSRDKKNISPKFLEDISFVIMAEPEPQGDFIRYCDSQNISTLNLCDNCTLKDELKEDSFQRPHFHGAGFSPGISGLLARELYESFDLPLEIDLSSLSDWRTCPGRGAYLKSVQRVLSRVSYKGKIYEGFTQQKKISHFDMKRTQYLVSSGEVKLLNSLMNTVISSYTGFSSSFKNSLISFLKRWGILTFLYRKKMFPPRPSLYFSEKRSSPLERTGLKAEARGYKQGKLIYSSIEIRAGGFYESAARCILILMKRFRNSSIKPGFYSPFELITFRDLEEDFTWEVKRESGAEVLPERAPLSQYCTGKSFPEVSFSRF